MKPKAPTPLRGDPNVPPELARALKALRKGHDDGARIARVGEKLGPLLDAPMGAPSIAGWLRAASGAPLVKLVVVALVGAGLAAGWASGALTPGAEPARSQRMGVASEPGVASDEVGIHELGETMGNVRPSPRDTAVADAALVGPTNPATSVGDTPVRLASHSTPSSFDARPARRSRRARSQRRQATPVSIPPQPEAARGREAQALAMAPPPQPTQRSTPLVPAAVERPEAPIQEPTGAPAPPMRALTEVQLLMAARRALATDPAAALRWVAEHVERFPRGTLVPEREVLAIRALKALGRTRAAEQRLKRFGASYPDSAHLHPDF